MLKLLSLVILTLSSQIIAEEIAEDYSIITDAREIRLVFEQCTRMTPSFRTGYRKLDMLKVLEVEKMLPQALAAHAKGKTIKLDDYYRQYVAFDLLRRELVYVNAIHKDAIKQWAGDDAARKELIADWRNRAISVCGGGETNYWGALYDGQMGTIAEILFNSPAKVVE